jgi:hypothetical protein
MSAQEPPRRPPEETQPTERLGAPVPPPPRTPRPGPPPAQQGAVEREHAPYEPPPERPWWSTPGGLFAVLLVALLLGGLVGYAIGKGSEGSGTSAPHTVTNTVTSTQVHTVTSKTVTQAPANQANEERRVEAETKARKLERENEELKRQAEAGA